MEPAQSISEKETIEKNRPGVFNLSNETVFVLVCALFAFLIRFFLIPQASVINGDGIYYAILGKKIISGDIYGGISAYWSPLYSFLIGISSLFFQDLEFAGRFVSVVAGTLLIFPAYFLIRNFYGRRSAYLGTILLVIHPSLILSSTWVMTESLYALIFTTAILIGSYALRHGKKRFFFIIGLLFGAAYLTKPESLAFIGLFFVLTAGAKFFRRNLQFRRLIAGYLLLLSGFAVFFLPYVVFLHQKTGHWTISQKLLSNVPSFDSGKGLLKLTDNGQITMRDRLFGDVYDPENQPTVNQPTVNQPIVNQPLIASAPPESPHSRFGIGQLISKTFDNLKKQVREHIPAILPYPFILLAIIGLFFRHWTKRRTAKEIYLFSFVACTFIGYALTVIELRYLFTIIPILIGWASFGIVGFSNFVSTTVSGFLKTNRKVNPIWLQIFILITLAAFLKPLFSSQYKPEELQNVPFEEKQAGLWLKHRISQPSLIMASNATSAFYAEAKHIYVPDEEFSVVLEYAKRKKVDYLVFSQRRLNNTPNAFPINEENLPGELKLVYKDEQNPNYKILIYQLLN
ncbi:MAG: glycosyltransferase family 39 protein [Actinomycetota bacterium]